MGTQGIISIVKDNKVIFKCVAGCGGMTASKTANELKELAEPTLEKVYEVCTKNKFGCDSCLIVQSSDNYLGTVIKPNLSPLYETKFQDAKFNPRWEYGTAEYVEVVEC